MKQLRPVSVDRMVRAVEKVRERLLRAVHALEQAGVPYAVVGGHAVAAWVTRVDEAAVRKTPDVDVLIRRTDFDPAARALESAGVAWCEESRLDGPLGKARGAVHIIFAGEKVRPREPVGNPDVTASEAGGDFRVLSLEALVQIKLTAFRDKDRVHLRDLLDVGLIDETWCARFPAELGDRLRLLIDTPES